MLQLGRSQRCYRSQSSVSAAFGGEEQHLHDRIEVTVNQDSPQPSLPDCSGPSSCCDKKFWYQTCFELRTRIDFDHSARAFDASDVGKEGPQLQTLFGGEPQLDASRTQHHAGCSGSFNGFRDETYRGERITLLPGLLMQDIFCASCESLVEAQRAADSKPKEAEEAIARGRMSLRCVDLP